MGLRPKCRADTRTIHVLTLISPFSVSIRVLLIGLVDVATWVCDRSVERNLLIFLIWPLEVLKGLMQSSKTHDWIDNVNHSHSSLLLLGCATAVSVSQIVGDTIHCWVPAEFTGAYEMYANRYCWTHNTYFVPIMQPIPVDIQARQATEITYYQWVPLILLLQAFLFKLPNLIWKGTNRYSGINLSKICKAVENTQLLDPADRRKSIENMAQLFNRWIMNNRRYKSNRIDRGFAKVSSGCWFMCSRRNGTFYSGLYLTIKLLFLLNVIGQFFMLNVFMSDDYSLYGFQYMDMWIKGRSIKDNPRFPRITLCDFEIREFNHLREWTVQCVLPINLFNEKIFIFLWFWFFVLSILTGLMFVKWMYLIGYKGSNYTFVKEHLMMVDSIPTATDKKLCKRFANKYLRNDGCFVARMMGINTNGLLVTDLLDYMFQAYVSTDGDVKKSESFKNEEDDDDSYKDDESKLMMHNGHNTNM